MNLDDMLKTDGVSRTELEARIARLLPVVRTADALVKADYAVTNATAEGEGVAQERYERAWDDLRAALKRLTLEFPVP